MRLLSAIITAVLGVSCNEHAPLREYNNAQNHALAQSKLIELAPAEGKFTGKMHILKDGGDYDCVVTIKRFLDSAKSEQPTEVTEVPRLSGSLTFPFLENASPEEKKNSTALLYPMGYLAFVIFDHGTPVNNIS